MPAHLIAGGYKNVSFIAAQRDPRTRRRAEGYRRLLKGAGLYDPRLELLSPQPSSIRLGAELLEEVLRTRPGVDAVFFCNDDLAQGGLLAAQRLSLAVPGRVAIAGFNDLAGSDQMLPPLTTVRTPRSAIGEASARMLLELMRGEVPERNAVLSQATGHWHDYGKLPRAGRKVGHATLRAETSGELANELERVGGLLAREWQVAPVRQALR